jgi:hypothetical protein
MPPASTKRTIRNATIRYRSQNRLNPLLRLLHILEDTKRSEAVPGSGRKGWISQSVISNRALPWSCPTLMVAFTGNMFLWKIVSSEFANILVLPRCVWRIAAFWNGVRWASFFSKDWPVNLTLNVTTPKSIKITSW